MKYIGVILGILGLDLGIKNYIEKNKTEGEEEKLGGFLLIRKHHNTGAFLNAGETKPKLVRALSVLLCILLTAVFAATFSMVGRGALRWGLTLMLGGAYSNTYDRLARKYVVDYVGFEVPQKKLRRVTFNVGDFCIMIGAMLCVIGFEK